MTSEAEERLNRLEEQNYFLEQTLKELNAALTGQQEVLQAQEQRLALAEARLRALLPLLEDGGRPEPPPHYGRHG